MRLRTLLMTASLVLVALSLPPAASAGPGCGTSPTSLEGPFGTTHTVQPEHTCEVHITLNEGLTCSDGTTESVHVPVRENTVTAYYCSIAPMAATASAPGCPPRTIEWEGPFGTNRVEQEHNCRTTTTLNEGTVCLGGSVDRDEYSVLGHTVIVYSCGNPDQGGISDPVATSTATGGCPWLGLYTVSTPAADVSAETRYSCYRNVDVDQNGPCPFGNEEDLSGADGAVTLHVCAPEPRAGQASAPGCEPWGVHAETVLGGVYVGVDENCRPDVRNNGGPLGATTSAPGCEPTGTHAETVLGGVYVGVDEGCRPDVRHNGGPTATTSAAPGCPPRDESTGYGLGSVRVEQEHNCRVTITVNEGIDCVGAYTRSFSTDVSGSTVTAYYCAPPRAETTSASAAPSCQKVPSLGVVSVSDDCHTVSLRLYDCFWGGYWNERPVGPFTVRDYRCGPPPTTSTAAAPSCQKVPSLGVVSVSDDCHTVSIKLYECFWGGYWNERPVGPFTVRDYRCGPPPTTAASIDPFPTCVREPCGPELPGPRAPCSDLQGQGGAVATYTLDAGCNLDVEVKLYDCVWNGHWRTVGAGPASVSVYQCGAPETTQAAANPFPTCVTEPCGPSVPGPCDTLQAVGYNDGFNTLSFRSDCTFELGVMDGATCVGGWGQTTERDVAGNTVRTTVCDGGLGDRLGGIVKPTSTAAAPFRCAYVYEDVHGPLGTSSVEGEHTCWFNVVVSEGIHCTGGDAERTERQVLNVNVVAYTCDGPDADTTASAGGPCDRIQGPIQSEELTWTIDDRCRHDIYVDVIECPNQSQWTKTDEQYQVHPNLTLHYTFCRLG